MEWPSGWKRRRGIFLGAFSLIGIFMDMELFGFIDIKVRYQHLQGHCMGIGMDGKGGWDMSMAFISHSLADTTYIQHQHNMSNLGGVEIEIGY